MKFTLPKLIFVSLLILNCTVSKSTKNSKSEKLEEETMDNAITKQKSIMDQKIYTFLTFQKENAEEAMNYYIDLFDNSEVINIQRWGKGAPSKEGTIMHATFKLNGSLFMCSDSPPVHEWDFTPAVSNFVECESDNELERLFTKLSENGQVTMPLNNYGFSQKFGWVIDQFGVSWQLNLK